MPAIGWWAAPLVAGVTMISLVLDDRAWAGKLPGAFVCEFATGFFSAPEGKRFATSEAYDMLNLTYASIDQRRGTAQMITNAGAGKVTLLVGLPLCTLWKSQATALAVGAGALNEALTEELGKANLRTESAMGLVPEPGKRN